MALLAIGELQCPEATLWMPVARGGTREPGPLRSVVESGHEGTRVPDVLFKVLKASLWTGRSASHAGPRARASHPAPWNTVSLVRRRSREATL